MSKYTTGEIAKLCGVSVRTVQYYDNRGILVPSELSDGGRRLYSEDDLKRMHIICFLRDAGFPINSISALFEEKNPGAIISVIIEQQEQALRTDMLELQKQQKLIDGIKRELKEVENFSVESIGDIASIMKSKNELNKMRWQMIFAGVPVAILQWVSIILWATKGIWWLFAVWGVVAVVYGVWVSKYYFGHVAYICPECHEVFKPRFKEAFWAYHTPKMRKLTCPNCGNKGMCVEVYANKEDDNA